MTIGVDGNEANVQNRVGSGAYAFELLKQFAKTTQYSSSESSNNSTSREVTAKSRIFSKESSRQARTIKFTVYLKDQSLPDLPKETENFKYVVFGPKKFWTQFALPLKLKFGPKIDVLFSPAHYGPRFSRVPYVITIHDLSYLHYPEMFKKDDLYQLTSWSKYSIENSAHIIAPSKTTKYDIVKNYGVDEAKIAVTYEGYDQKRFKPQPKLAIDRIKGKFKIKGNYLIFVGTLQPRKNLERLLEAFRILVHSSQFTVHNRKKSVNRQPLASLRERSGSTVNLLLVIAGKKGWLYESIFAKVKELNLEDKVIFTDYVLDDDLPALIGGASVYVLPSLWEGFGIPVVEAQACGIPVVVSKTSSLPEIVGDSGILVDPESTDSIAGGIKKALEPKTRIIFVKRGFENIKRFSWENCALETLKVLEGVGQNK